VILRSSLRDDDAGGAGVKLAQLCRADHARPNVRRQLDPFEVARVDGHLGAHAEPAHGFHEGGEVTRQILPDREHVGLALRQRPGREEALVDPEERGVRPRGIETRLLEQLLAL